MDTERLRICFGKNVLSICPNTPEAIHDTSPMDVDEILPMQIELNDHGRLTIREQSSDAGEFESFNDIFDIFASTIENMQLKHSGTDKIFQLTETVVMNCFELFQNFLNHSTSMMNY